MQLWKELDSITCYSIFTVNDDYSVTSQVLTFGASSVIGATLNAMVPIVDDNLCERTETVNVEGSVTEARARFQEPQTFCDIMDDDGMLRMIKVGMVAV